jgi:predicted component of type VI protein secretion system
LGVDSVVGDGREDLAQLTLVIGPVPIERYLAFQDGQGKELLQAVLYLVTPYHQRYEVSWSVEDRRRAPRLGMETANGRLGLNSHLGREAVAAREGHVTV